MKKPPKNKQQAGWDYLHRHGDPPSRRRGEIHVDVDAVVDPKTNERTRLVCDFKQTSQNTSNGCN